MVEDVDNSLLTGEHLNTLYNLLYIKEDLKVYKQRLKVEREKDRSTHYILLQRTKSR